MTEMRMAFLLLLLLHTQQGKAIGIVQSRLTLKSALFENLVSSIVHELGQVIISVLTSFS